MTAEAPAEASSVRFEPPDTFVWTFIGDVTAETLQASIRLAKR